MVMAFDLSVKMGLCPKVDAVTVRRHLEKITLPTKPPLSRVNMTADNLFNHTLHDKKMSGGTATFVLVSAIGGAFLSRDTQAGDIRQIFLSALD